MSLSEQLVHSDNSEQIEQKRH